jgi:hypothetical protein
MNNIFDLIRIKSLTFSTSMVLWKYPNIVFKVECRKITTTIERKRIPSIASKDLFFFLEFGSVTGRDINFFQFVTIENDTRSLLAETIAVLLA